MENKLVNIEVMSNDIALQTEAKKLTKKNAQASAVSILANVEFGLADPVQTYIQANYIENMAKEVKDKLKDKVMEIADNEYKGNIEMYGISCKNVTRKTFSGYEQDPTWCKLDQELSSVKEQIKEREKYLESIKGNVITDGAGNVLKIEYPTTVDPITGEVIELKPLAIKHSTSPTITELK